MIVNSVFTYLDLNQGALSGAIFHAAGPKLQVLVNAQMQIRNRSVKPGDIIVTGGCQLNSKFVYHTLTPSRNTAKALFQKVMLFSLGFVS